jgi:hypothetical protein
VDFPGFKREREGLDVATKNKARHERCAFDGPRRLTNVDANATKTAEMKKAS